MRRIWLSAFCGLALLLGAGAARAQTQPCAQTIAPKIVSASTYTVNTTDRCGWILLTSVGAVTVSLPTPNLIFAPNFGFTILPLNGGTVTFVVTPDPSTGLTSVVNGQSSLVLGAGGGAVLSIQQDMKWYALLTGTESASTTSITATSPIVVTPSPLTTTGVVSHANSGVSAGSYTAANITVNATGHITAASNGTVGSVTSVGLSSPGGIFGITGTNPITTTGTFGYTTTGTSGGIPYFSSTSVLSSSGLLDAHQAVIGGGAGSAPTSVAGCTGGVFWWATSGTDPVCTANPTLGASGTAGTLSMGNNTSGVVELAAVTGQALGVSLATFPANSGAVAELNLAQSWTAAQRGTPVNVTISTATFTPNFDAGNHFEIDLTSACPCTLANPSTTLVPGQSGIIEIHQDGTGSRTIGTWGSDYRYAGGTSTITLSTAASAKDYLAYYVNAAGTGIVFGTIINNPSH